MTTGPINRRTALGAAALAGATAYARPALSQGRFPNRPVRRGDA